MRRFVAMVVLFCVAGVVLCGCGPKPSEAEKNTPPPPSAANPRAWTPPPAGANGAGAPPGAPAGSGR